MLDLAILNEEVKKRKVKIYCGQEKVESAFDIPRDLKHYSVSLQLGYNYTNLCEMTPIVTLDDHENKKHYSIHYGPETHFDEILAVMGLGYDMAYGSKMDEKVGMFLGELRYIGEVQRNVSPKTGSRGSTSGCFWIHEHNGKKKYGISARGDKDDKLSAFDSINDAMDYVHTKYIEKGKDLGTSK